MRLLAILCSVFLYVFAVDTALAQQDLQPAESTKVYSADNPFAGSQYTDLADLTELLLQQGYNVDNYFYSEGFSTGIDGTLGNEYVCFRDDTNKVYIGRSDICRNREMDSTYSYIQIDKMDWTNGFPDLTILQTGDLLGDTSQYWDGCYTLNEGWAGYSGGFCPTINDFAGGQINYGYINRVLTNSAAINLALQDLGIEVTGYTYSWSVKNLDAERGADGNSRGVADPFRVTVTIRDENNNAVFSKTYDYSYYMGWSNFSGEETFEEPFDASTLSEVELSISGYDLGYWAGYYGPEFRNPNIKLNYRATGSGQEDTTIEDLLFDQMCMSDPLSDINCPGYNDAFLAQMNNSIVQEDFGIASGIDDGMGDVIDVTGINDVTGVPDILDTDPTPDPISDPVSLSEEVIAVEEVLTESPLEASPTESAAEPSQAAEGGQRSGGGLSANQRFALDQAQQASAASEQTASDQNQSSVEASNQANGDTSGFGADGQMAENSLSSDISGGSFSTSFDGDATSDSFDVIVNEIVSTIVNAVSLAAIESPAEKEMTQEERNQQEDELVEAALEGNEEEDARAALLGFNPNFRAYEQPQMTDSQFYQPKEIYEGQQNYDNPSARFFNGASDATHRQMVRQQYERN